MHLLQLHVQVHVILLLCNTNYWQHSSRFLCIVYVHIQENIMLS